MEKIDARKLPREAQDEMRRQAMRIREEEITLEGDCQCGGRQCEHGHGLIQALCHGRFVGPEVEGAGTALPFWPHADVGPGVAVTCRVPDDCIDASRHALFVSREVMRDLMEEIRSPAS